MCTCKDGQATLKEEERGGVSAAACVSFLRSLYFSCSFLHSPPPSPPLYLPVIGGHQTGVHRRVQVQPCRFLRFLEEGLGLKEGEGRREGRREVGRGGG